MTLEQDILSRRTFAIISHPAAGKTTITEKLLLFGGAIRDAGTVKGKKTGKFATEEVQQKYIDYCNERNGTKK